MRDTTAAYLVLTDGSIHDGGSYPAASLYVKGTLDQGRFMPQGDIEGEGALGEAGQPGWMELADGAFHGDMTSRPPFPPFVRGFRSPQGEFRPKSRQVQY